MNPLTDEEKQTYKNSKDCYLCENPFTSKDYKVRDHDHLTGNYRGPAHTSCNSKY